ncbi:high-affinity branched-chain amino acid ABC transporter permease LivM [Caenispirillum bisanense]|uniref:high-affinity branched-chain amino acid ABC transporter permease LivM n=1 Tax=Caenispirillum bisanense TaxID=414052 RepID=UPI0031D01600
MASDIASPSAAAAAKSVGPYDVVAALKESAITAGVAAILALPFLGLQANNDGPNLVLLTRWELFFWAVGLVFLGRMVLTVLRWRGQIRTKSGAAARTSSRLKAAGEKFHRLNVWIGLAGVIFAFALPFLPFADRYVIDIATTLLIYVMLGWGLNIVVGLAGLLDLGYVAFYAVGAYSYALLSTHFGLSFWVCLPLAGIFAASFGVILGFPVLRLRGDYLAIVTLGFGEIIRVILINWYPVTRGPDGIGSIERPSFFGFPFERSPAEDVTSFHQLFGLDFSSMHRIVFLYFLILILALITNAFTQRVRKLPVGRGWEALREDEIACRSLGMNPTNTKLSAFAIGAMFGGFAGAFFATRQGFISPESFTFIESAIILAIVVLGGMGSQMGVVIAAFVLVIVPEWLRGFAEYRMLLFGLAMVLIMVWRPRGLLSHRDPTVRLHPPGYVPRTGIEAQAVKAQEAELAAASVQAK